MLDEAAAFAVNLLPVVTEKSELRALACIQKVSLDCFYKACVRVLIFVNQKDREARLQDRSELRIG